MFWCYRHLGNIRNSSIRLFLGTVFSAKPMSLAPVIRRSSVLGRGPRTQAFLSRPLSSHSATRRLSFCLYRCMDKSYGQPLPQSCLRETRFHQVVDSLSTSCFRAWPHLDKEFISRNRTSIADSALRIYWGCLPAVKMGWICSTHPPPVGGTYFQGRPHVKPVRVTGLSPNGDGRHGGRMHQLISKLLMTRGAPEGPLKKVIWRDSS